MGKAVEGNELTMQSTVIEHYVWIKEGGVVGAPLIGLAFFFGIMLSRFRKRKYLNLILLPKPQGGGGECCLVGTQGSQPLR